LPDGKGGRLSKGRGFAGRPGKPGAVRASCGRRRPRNRRACRWRESRGRAVRDGQGRPRRAWVRPTEARRDHPGCCLHAGASISSGKSATRMLRRTGRMLRSCGGGRL